MPNKLIFFGTEDFSTPFLNALIEGGYEVACVVTKPDSARGRSAEPVRPEVKTMSEQHDIPVLQPENLSQLADSLSEWGTKAGVLASYGRIIPDNLLELFPEGIINVHPSDLPKHRGPSPIEQTILDGDKQTAVSLMKLAKEMDAGPVYAKVKLNVSDNISKPDLKESLIKAGASLMLDKLPAILSGQLKPTPQDDSRATYTQLIKKSDGQIDWSHTAQNIERQVRAYQGWPGSFTELFGVRITIHEANNIDESGLPGEHFISPNGLLSIYCGQSALELKVVQPAGKKPMSSADFIRGYAAS
ncbi:MAG TPA: methionyl-tRNA formyltransferase [Candidatus Saccharimonadales bacterium]